ncbi:hypothetical protein OHA72_14245 [Dactylosporangium sp. NBC_01737]|uniref:hypothetical protein n=1 Tax=Dactylosporangium sp. NBC_01737 TaxID=2975959 RepID=UPI002E0F1E1D|nr:hypothetical protein OHA72_14245 [Dactylosporangium sp. NBC_01737]
MTPAEPLTVDVTDGLGVVEVLGNDAASVLYLSGAPVWVHAYDCHGSVGELAARAGDAGWDAPRPAELGALRDWLAEPGLRVERGRRGAAPLDRVHGLRVEPLLPLLRLFCNGRYLVSARTMSLAVTVFDRVEADWFAWYSGYRDDDDYILATDRWPAPGLGTVEEHRARIARGIRPALVAVGPPGGAGRYLLDGHHKLAAYRKARVRPLVIDIVPAEPRPLPKALFADLLPERARGEFSQALDGWRWGGPPPDGPGG